MSNLRLVPVILSGGAGTRLWPLSRETAPKPLMPLPDGETLLAKTAARALALPGVAELVTVTNRDYYFHTKDVYAGLRGRLPGAPRSCSSRSGATRRRPSRSPRSGSRTRNGGDAVLLVLPADHLIRDQAAFAAAVARGGAARQRRARSSPSASAPRMPETGFGYIECGAAAPGDAPPAFAARRFVEKPPLGAGARVPRRRQLRLELGDVLLHARRRSSPRSRGTRRRVARRGARRCRRRSPPRAIAAMLEIDAALFAAAPDISLDYAVMEKAAAAGEVGVVRGTFDWSDVGSWQAVAELVRGRCATATAASGERVAIATAGHLRPRRGSRGRDGRRREPRHRRHARRGAGRPPRPPAARQGGRRRAEGARPRVLPAAQDRRAAVGRLHGAAGGPRLQDQADRGEARRGAVAAASSPPQRALGRRRRHRARDARRGRPSSSAPTGRRTSRSRRGIGSRTRRASRW